jgi:hypothetical protein
MPYTCIICGNPAGSAEHLFPSALGGLRKNKKIYCDYHNNAFGSYVVVLEEQLRIYNASLGLTTDRRPTVKPAALTNTDDGSTVLMTDTVLRHQPDLQAALDAAVEGAETRIKVGSKEDIETLKNLALQKGLKLSVVRSETGQSLTAGKLQGRMSFGSDDSLRAVSYLGLTFFAHHLQSLARLPELAGIKNFVRFGSCYAGKNDAVTDVTFLKPDEFCWWIDDISAISGSAPFDFWHAVGVCVKDGIASAYVSLFGALNFYVRLGASIDIPDAAVVTYIDPLAKVQPNEWHERTGPDYGFVSSSGENFFHHPNHSRLTVERLQHLADRIQDKQESERSAKAVEVIDAAAKISAEKLAAAFDSEVISRRQQVFNILQEMAEIDFGDLVVDSFLQKCVASPSTEASVSDEAEAVLRDSGAKFKQQLAGMQMLGMLSSNQITELFTGMKARMLVLASVLSCATRFASS